MQADVGFDASGQASRIQHENWQSGQGFGDGVVSTFKHRRNATSGLPRRPGKWASKRSPPSGKACANALWLRNEVNWSIGAAGSRGRHIAKVHEMTVVLAVE